jgi:metal-responsive CopG/Arc/MetJ family transcriptional regulator
MQMCDTLKRFGVSMEPALLSQLDALVVTKGFQNRSQAIRSIVRQSLLQNLVQKEVIFASIDMSKDELATRFSQVLHRCEEWGTIQSFTTVFVDYQTVSIHFTMELPTSNVAMMQQDALLRPMIIHKKRSDIDETNI